MRYPYLMIAAALALVGDSLPGQEPRDWLEQFDRSKDAIVLESPHFERPPPDPRPGTCPPSPMQIYGFEGEAAGALRLRVLSYDIDRVVLDPVAIPVRLSYRFGPEGEELLPSDQPWFQYTDSTGLASFPVPPGVYRLDILVPGNAGGDGVIRVRGAAGDSLRVLLSPGLLCDQ